MKVCAITLFTLVVATAQEFSPNQPKPNYDAFEVALKGAKEASSRLQDIVNFVDSTMITAKASVDNELDQVLKTIDAAVKATANGFADFIGFLVSQATKMGLKYADSLQAALGLDSNTVLGQEQVDNINNVIRSLEDAGRCAATQQEVDKSTNSLNSISGYFDETSEDLITAITTLLSTIKNASKEVVELMESVAAAINKGDSKEIVGALKSAMGTLTNNKSFATMIDVTKSATNSIRSILTITLLTSE